MDSMVVTRDTSQLEMSPLNFSVPETSDESKTSSMSVTAETSQDPIGPCGPLEQSLDSFRHCSMVGRSSAFDFGANTVVAVVVVVVVYYYSWMDGVKARFIPRFVWKISLVLVVYYKGESWVLFGCGQWWVGGLWMCEVSH